MRKTTFAILTFAFIMTINKNIHAENYYANRWAIGAGYGVSYPKRPEANFKEIYDHGRNINGFLQYGISHDLSLVGSYSNILVKQKSNDQELELQPILLSFKYHPYTESSLVPYLKVGAGISSNRQEVLGETTDIRWNKFVAQGGLGLELFINPGFSLGVEGLYQHFVATPDQSPYRLLSALGSINIYFGEDNTTKKLRAEKKVSEEAAARLKEEKEQLEKTSQAQIENSQKAADDAEKARMLAEQQKTDAERQAQELQGQVQQAQNEMDEIKNMIARKDISPINFATGSDKLLVDSYQSLDKVAETAKKYPTLKLRIEGHTDNVGDDASNMKLSQKRAEAVRTYLISKGSLDSNLIEAVGFGESKPITSNDTAEGRAKNRRVEFMFSVNK